MHDYNMKSIVRVEFWKSGSYELNERLQQLRRYSTELIRFVIQIKETNT